MEDNTPTKQYLQRFDKLESLQNLLNSLVEQRLNNAAHDQERVEVLTITTRLVSDIVKELNELLIAMNNVFAKE